MYLNYYLVINILLFYAFVFSLQPTSRSIIIKLIVSCANEKNVFSCRKKIKIVDDFLNYHNN